MLRCTMPKTWRLDDPCGAVQGSDECFKIVCPTCTIFQEKDNVEKYTDENLSLEVKNATEGLLSNIVPGDLGGRCVSS